MVTANTPEAVAQILYKLRPKGLDDVIEVAMSAYDLGIQTLVTAGFTQGWEHVEEGVELYKKMLTESQGK